jgi:hypothetical protein
MPSVSKKQHNFMAAVANNPEFAKKAGVPQSVGKEFSNADKNRKFSKGGDTMATTKMGKPTMKPGMSTAKDGMKKPTPMANTSMGGGMGMKKGGMPMKMKDGKKVPIFAAKGGGIESKGKTKGKMITMKSGGKTC